MVRQPILSDTVTSFGEMKLYAVMCEPYYEMGNTEVDGAHIHSCYEIYVNISGDISFFHDSTVYDIRPFDVIVSYPGDVHYCIYHSSCLHEHCCIWFYSDEVGDFLERRGIRGKIELLQSDQKHILRLLQKLTESGEDPFLRSAIFMELLSAIDAESKEQKEKTITFLLRLRICFVILISTYPTFPAVRLFPVHFSSQSLPSTVCLKNTLGFR